MVHGLDEIIRTRLLRIAAGVVRLPGMIQGWQTDRHDNFQPIPGLPLPGRGHPARSMAVSLFSLSLRNVETILAARGIAVSYETIRAWSLRFGRLFANGLKQRRPRPGDKWHLDEVFIRVQGQLDYLWRAVDQDGHVLDILVQSRRSARAAKRFFRSFASCCGVCSMRRG